jgi:hypothetical protein
MKRVNDRMPRKCDSISALWKVKSIRTTFFRKSWHHSFFQGNVNQHDLIFWLCEKTPVAATYRDQ